MVFERNKLIRFHHCDPAGIVFYPQYLVLCNEIVEDWFDEGIGIDFYDLHSKHRRAVPMRHLEADFLATSVHGDELCFSLRLERIGGSSMTLAIGAEKDGKVRFSVRQTVVWVDLDHFRPIRIEPDWRRRFEAYLAEVAR